MQRAVMIGAGATGRGHIGLMLYEHGWRVTFVDRKPDLIEALRKHSGYSVRLFGKSGGTVKVEGCDYLHVTESGAIAKAVGRADLVCTAVFDENLPDVAVTLLAALKGRRSGGNNEPLHIICCENMMNSSSTLKQHVYDRADEAMCSWLDAHTAFPDSMISRIVPQPEPEALDLVAEDYNEWTVDAAAMRADLELPVLQPVHDQTAYLERKLFIHNGGHAVCGYFGYHLGHRYIHEAVGDLRVAEIVGRAVDELGEVILHKHPLFNRKTIEKYKADLGVRGAVAELKDQILRVVRDPVRKLSPRERLVAPALYAAEHGLGFEWLAKSIAAVLRYDNPSDQQSASLVTMLESEGCGKVISKTCGIEPGTTLFAAVVQSYDKFPGFLERLKEGGL